MINSGIFDYINVLDKAADASYQRNIAISNNIANATTPGYKRVDVDFQSVLTQELGKSKYTTLDRKMKNVDLSHLTVTTKVDTTAEGFSYRIDGNNVDPDTENVELASNQLYYQGVIGSMGQEFSRIKTAMS